MRANRAVFLDKDGTLVEDDGYSPGPWRLRPNALQSLKMLRDAGYLLVIVTNQSGVARGMFTEARLIESLSGLCRHMAGCGARVDGFYYCPHGQADGCDCRKPEPGMLLQAARELDIDLSRSWMVGDRDTDIEAGSRAGCRTIRAGDLLEAAREICRTS